jgi:hypothetical protein
MADMLSYFMGRDGFTWFIGVCEDRDDPKALGRIRVRCFGYHTDDLTKIPTQDLPWAQVILPPTAQVGAFHNIKPGDWVFGFFRDPDYLQEPVIMGILPGTPASAPDPTKGFSDPNSPDAPDTQDTKYKKEPDFGPYPSRVGKADTSRLTSGLLEAHPEIEARDTAATEEVPTANESKILGDADSTVDVASQWTDKIATNTDLTATTWKEPKTTDDSIRGKDATGKNPETQEDRVPPYKRRNTEYPYNHVLETEGGHIKEYDDTPYAERIYEKHKSGTYYEIDADGNKVTRVVGQNYEIIAGNNFCNIKGDVNLTIDSNCKTYIKGDWNIQVDGNKTEVVKKNVTETYGTENANHTHTISITGKRAETVSNSVTETYQDAKTETVTKDVTETYGANQTTKITGNLDVDAARIDLN